MQRDQSSERDAAFAVLPDAVVVTDERRCVVGWNPRARQLLGFAAEEVVGRPAAEVLGGPHSAVWLRHLDEVARHGCTRTICGARCRDGREIHVDISSGSVPGGGAVSVLRETAAGSARRPGELEQLILGVVSHDLRNPIGSALLATTTLLRYTHLDEKQRGILGRLQSSVERLGRMVGDLLDYAQDQGGAGIPVQRAPTDLHVVTARHLEELGFTERIRHVPEGDGRAELDADRIAQVVGNLVGNALQHGSVEVPVEVRTVGTPHEVVLEVRNQGTPIPPERLTSIFEPFHRARNRRSGAAGRSIGLGLFITRQLVRAHGGSVEVRSSSEHGTVFTVRIPRAA